jgi:hypothetical protein
MMFVEHYEADMNRIVGRMIHHTSEEAQTDFNPPMNDFIHVSIPERFIARFGTSMHTLNFKKAENVHDPAQILPPEMMHKILSHLNRPFDKTRAAKTCKTWNALAKSDIVWKGPMRFHERFGVVDVTNKVQCKELWKESHRSAKIEYSAAQMPDHDYYDSEPDMCFSIFD